MCYISEELWMKKFSSNLVQQEAYKLICLLGETPFWPNQIDSSLKKRDSLGKCLVLAQRTIICQSTPSESTKGH